MAVVQETSDRDRDYRPSKGKRGRPPNKAKLFCQKTPVDTRNQASSCNRQKRRNRCSIGSVYDTTCEARLAVHKRAKEVQDNLSPQFPSLVKCMLPSHVSGCFWLGLPKEFCDLHLPKSDNTIIDLEDESGKLYPTVYLRRKVGLSGGWRGFSMAHNLNVMDVLVFHLVQPSKFKVYIIRSQGSDEMGGALGLLKLTDCSEQNDEVDGTIDTKGNDPNNSTMIIGAPISQPDWPENEITSKDLCSEEQWNGIRFSESVISFKEVADIENFSIVVDGLVIDSEVPKHVRNKYYELCCSQGSYLHEHLIAGLNCKLVSGMIAETVNIADAIKASNIGTTSPDSLVLWDKTLKAFEDMGMNVRFLLNRLQQLVQVALKSKRYKEARIEREHAQEELRSIEAKLVELKEIVNRHDEEIVDMNPQRMEVMFQQLGNAPW